MPSKKEKEAGAKAVKNEKVAKQQEDAEWKAAGEGAKSKAQAAKDKAAAQKQEQDAKRAEAKRLAAEEEKEMAKLAKKGGASKQPVAPKVTAFQLQKEKEKDRAVREAAKKAAPADRVVTEESYGALVDGENVNRLGEGASARDVDSAIAALSVSGQPEVDAHPERRQKAAHLAFEETEVARLREEKPGLRSSQYKEMAFKNWQKCPLNPKLQAAAAAAAAAAAQQ